MWYRIWRSGVLAALALAATAGVPLPAAPPALTGQVVSADGASTAGIRLHLRLAGHADSATVDDAGRFALRLPEPLPTDSVVLLVEPAGDAAARFHPTARRLHPRELAAEQWIVLVPRRWTVGAGRYAGEAVEISIESAYRPTCPGCEGFFRRVSAMGPAVTSAGVPAWPEESFPLRVAFDRGWSEAPITARDSVAFWRSAVEVEAAFGRPLFRPVPFHETAPVDDAPGDVILVWVVPSIRASGRGSVGFHRETIIQGALWLRGTSAIHEPGGRSLVAHELLHTLGYGHTCSWRSVLADTVRCPGRRSDVPTADDVAYVELARAVTALTTGARNAWGLEAAHAAETGLFRLPAAVGVPPRPAAQLAPPS